jgi:hypothetical protein
VVLNRSTGTPTWQGAMAQAATFHGG